MHPTRRSVEALLAIAIVAAFALGLASAAPADQIVVTTTDGRQHEGELIDQDDQQVTLEINGTQTTIKLDDVRDIKPATTVADEYRERRAKLDDQDLPKRRALVGWLIHTKRSYELAQQELADLAKRFPDDPAVQKLVKDVERRLKLRDEGKGRNGKKTPQKDNRLTKEQINLIKVYEVDPGRRAGPKIVVPREVIDELIANYADRDEGEPLRGKRNQQKFRRSSSAEQLRLIFRLKARELYAKVLIRSDPLPLATFRKSIHRQYVLNYCGTTKCHGRPDAPGLALFTKRGTDEATAYTNFYLLHDYERGEGYMIDRDKPQQSYLIQFGLPREEARTPHPEANGWEPRFRKADLPIQRRLIEWIEQLYSDPIPDYPIKYPPGDKELDEEENDADETPPAKPPAKKRRSRPDADADS